MIIRGEMKWRHRTADKERRMAKSMEKRSSEKFNHANVTPGTCVSSAFWSRLKSDSNVSLDTLNIRLHASYTDGRVESFCPGQTLPMRVSLTTDGSVPYPAGILGDPWLFYLPITRRLQNRLGAKLHSRENNVHRDL